MKVSDLPVMRQCCKTCPFREKDGKQQNVELANKVLERTLFKGQQICHGSEGKNRKATHRCRGSFDHNKTIYERLGYPNLISEDINHLNDGL